MKPKKVTKVKKSREPKEPKEPRFLAFVKLADWMTDEQRNHYVEIFGSAAALLYLGEIPNMRGHCVIYSKDTNKMFVGYHIENFVEMSEEET
jgi:hypothetical protein